MSKKSYDTHLNDSGAFRNTAKRLFQSVDATYAFVLIYAVSAIKESLHAYLTRLLELPSTTLSDELRGQLKDANGQDQMPKLVQWAEAAGLKLDVRLPDRRASVTLSEAIETLNKLRNIVVHVDPSKKIERSQADLALRAAQKVKEQVEKAIQAHIQRERRQEPITPPAAGVSGSYSPPSDQEGGIGSDGPPDEDGQEESSESYNGMPLPLMPSDDSDEANETALGTTSGSSRRRPWLALAIVALILLGIILGVIITLLLTGVLPLPVPLGQ